MSNLFNSGRNIGLSPKARLENNYNTARINLLVVVMFTLVNVLFTIFDMGYYFLFSASIPFYMTSFGMDVCGRYPREFYDQYYDVPYEELAFLDSTVFYVILAIVAVIIVLYFLCWLFSKKHVGWMVAALVLFTIDTVMLFLLYGVDFSMLLDYLFHIFVMFYLVYGLIANSKLKKLKDEPAEEAVAEGAQSDASFAEDFKVEENDAPGEPTEDEAQAPSDETESNDEIQH